MEGALKGMLISVHRPQSTTTSASMESDGSKHLTPPGCEKDVDGMDGSPSPSIHPSLKRGSGKRLLLPRPATQKAGRATVRLVDKSPAPDASPASNGPERPPPNDRQESAHEYSATGLDETTSRIPRKPSLKSRGKPAVPRPNRSNGSAGQLASGEEVTSNGLHLATVGTIPGEAEEAQTVGSVPETGIGSEKASDVPKEVEDSSANWVSYGPEGGGSPGVEKETRSQIETNGIHTAPNGDMGEIPDPDAVNYVGGIRFAPWNIPVRRRLQTVAIIFHSLSIAGLVSIFFFLCAIPFTWPLLIPYLLHMLISNAATDGRLRFRSERFRQLSWWAFFADYFPARLHKTHDLPDTRKYIFGYHPHGIISHGAFAAFATEACGFGEKFPGITNSLLTLDSNFRIPLYRDYILAMGLQSVSKESINNILTRGGPNGEGMGRAVTIVVGGARESLEAQPGIMHLILKERKGFIRLALRTGADLVPVLAFGENDLYDQVSPKTHPALHRFQTFVLRTLKFTLPFLHGRGIFNYDVGLMPYRRPLNIVVGHPIMVAQVAEPKSIDSAEVDRLHGLYVAELLRIWQTYKDQFAKDRKEDLQLFK